VHIDVKNPSPACDQIFLSRHNGIGITSRRHGSA
jgi:hypothetical protein